MAEATTVTRHSRRIGGIAASLLFPLLITACAGTALRSSRVTGGPLRISEMVESGDPRRRASTRLVLKGLAAGRSERAITHYQRAIQLDATNPYAYLALASHEIQWGDPVRGEQSLIQAKLLLESERADSPRVVPHLKGLTGRARIRSTENPAGSGRSLLKDARRLAPDIWGDGWLEAAELR